MYNEYTCIFPMRKLNLQHISMVSTFNNIRFNNVTSSQGASSPWSYGSSIYDYLCNQYISPLTLWVRIPLRRGVLNTTLCDKVSQWLAAGKWFSLGTPISFTNKTDRNDISEILLKVTSNTMTPNLPPQDLRTTSTKFALQKREC